MLRKGGSGGAGRNGGHETLETSSIAHKKTLAYHFIGQQAKRKHRLDPYGSSCNIVCDNEVAWKL